MTTRIAVIGAGLIGRRHIEAITQIPSVALSAVVDPTDESKAIASQHQVPHFDTVERLLDNHNTDGVIIATPNQLHVEMAMQFIAAGIPSLIEKPLAIDVAGAKQIVSAANAANVQVATGHHRRHNPLIMKAKALIDAGELGDITLANGTTWLYKPDDYFNVDWRKQKGAGPIYINLIHDIDLLRYFCGEIVSVYCMESNERRGFAVEDTAAILLQFSTGALGTMSLSDTVVAPWSWELTAKENPAYPATSELCYQIGGTKGSLSLPDLTLWSQHKGRSWMQQIDTSRFPFSFEDPLLAQIKQFAEVIKGEQLPLVSAEQGLRNQMVIEAIKASALSGERVTLEAR